MAQLKKCTASVHADPGQNGCTTQAYGTGKKDAFVAGHAQTEIYIFAATRLCVSFIKPDADAFEKHVCSNTPSRCGGSAISNMKVK